MINGDICYNNHTKTKAIYARTEGVEIIKDENNWQEEFDVILLYEDTDKEFSMTLKAFEENWNVPNPRREPAQFARNAKDAKAYAQKIVNENKEK